MIRPTLQDEIHDILKARGNAWMKIQDIVDLVNERDRCRNKDGAPVTLDQVFEIWCNHRNLFEREGTRIRCKENG